MFVTRVFLTVTLVKLPYYCKGNVINKVLTNTQVNLSQAIIITVNGLFAERENKNAPHLQLLSSNPCTRNMKRVTAANE